MLLSWACKSGGSLIFTLIAIRFRETFFTGNGSSQRTHIKVELFLDQPSLVSGLSQPIINEFL